MLVAIATWYSVRRERRTKVDGSLLPANGCDVVMCDESYTLELALDVDGTEVLVSGSAVVECVF